MVHPEGSLPAAGGPAAESIENRQSNDGLPSFLNISGDITSKWTHTKVETADNHSELAKILALLQTNKMRFGPAVRRAAEFFKPRFATPKVLGALQPTCDLCDLRPLFARQFQKIIPAANMICLLFAAIAVETLHGL